MDNYRVLYVYKHVRGLSFSLCLCFRWICQSLCTYKPASSYVRIAGKGRTEGTCENSSFGELVAERSPAAHLQDIYARFVEFPICKPRIDA